MTATECRVTLPFPPSVNTLYPTVIVNARARRVPSRRYKAWRDEAIILLKLAKLPRFEGRVVVRVILTAPDRRPRDADNYLKGPIDALVKAGVITDDRLVASATSTWAPEGGKAGVVIEVEAAKGGGRPQLRTTEQHALERLRRSGGRLTDPAHRVTQVMQSLIAKGYVRALPGLFEDAAPQGFIPID